MKIIYILIFIIFFSIISSNIPLSGLSIETLNPIESNINNTHTVFTGVATVQFCECCDEWSQYVYNQYNSGNYDFHYVEMIMFDHDGYKLNLEAIKWRNNYSISAIPTTVFDNDYKRTQGNNPDSFTDNINSSGNRIVANITANMTASWLGNATIKIEVSIKNNEQSQYNGFIRVYITEIVSRYTTYYGNPFHFGFLDFAINKQISIDAGGNYFKNVTWNGNEHEDSHGDDFGDIESDNIQLLLEIFNTNDDGYLDETVIAHIPNDPPNQPSDPNPFNGEIEVDVNSDLNWNCSDPNDNNLTYDVYYGTSNPPPLVSNNQTDNYYDPGKMDNFTKYYWQIIAWDPYCTFNISPIWIFTTGNETNKPPNQPYNPSPEHKEINVNLDSILTWTCNDPNGDIIYYDVYFEAEDSNPDVKVSDDQLETTFDPDILYPNTNYYWKIVAKDEHGASTIGPIWNFTTITNEPPYTPMIIGPSNGKPGVEYGYSFVSNDPEEEKIYYYIDWGDDTPGQWIGPYISGNSIIQNHTWIEKGTYTIRVKVKDIFDQESNWADFEVTIPRNKVTFYTLFYRLIGQFTILQKLLLQ
jgi:hypothetical protein